MNSIRRPQLRKEAYFGLIGELVKFFDGKTEADPVALLMHSLVFLGALNKGLTHFLLQGTRQKTNLYVGIVGPTGSGRKGTALNLIDAVFKSVDEDWYKTHVTGGLSTGEGLALHLTNSGITSCLLIEEEYARISATKARKENTLSAFLRSAYDGKQLGNLAAGNLIYLPNSHISLLVHSSPFELESVVEKVDFANGFANRFIWTYCERTHRVSDLRGKEFNMPDELKSALVQSVMYGRTICQVEIDTEAEAIWKGLYDDGQMDSPSGKMGELLVRGPSHIFRIAMIYALTQSSAIIRRPHLEAALAVWDYIIKSSYFIFGSTQSPFESKILTTLQIKGALTQSEIVHDIFGRNLDKNGIDGLRSSLLNKGLIEITTKHSGSGRPTTIWTLKSCDEGANHDTES